jgi:hypothetical protein
MRAAYTAQKRNTDKTHIIPFFLKNLREFFDITKGLCAVVNSSAGQPARKKTGMSQGPCRLIVLWSLAANVFKRSYARHAVWSDDYGATIFIQLA